MSLQQQPSAEEFRQAFLKAPRYFWPTFEHMHLNCFDLTSALLTFPGDISKDRDVNSTIYADFRFDINNLDTAPRRDEDYDMELWNESSLAVRWHLGQFTWACSVDVDNCTLTQGHFRACLSVTRYQNMDHIENILKVDQLKLALDTELHQGIDAGAFEPYSDEDISIRNICDRSWVCVRTSNSMKYPTYKIACSIDFQTCIFISAKLDSCWTQGEVVPAEVERKHLESLWDFLSQINLTHTRDGSFETGTVVREAPGQAEPAPDDYSW